MHLKLLFAQRLEQYQKCDKKVADLNRGKTKMGNRKYHFEENKKI